MTPSSVLNATVDDILGKPGAAFRVSMPLVLSCVGVVAVGFALLATFPQTDETLALLENGTLPLRPVDWIALLIGSVGVVICWLWTAIAWHRYVILGEQPGALLPRWPGGRMLGYLGRSILVGIAVLAISIVPLLLAAVLDPTSVFEDPVNGTTATYELGGMPPDFSLFSLIIWAALAAVVWGASLRIGIVLPARAIDRSVSLRQLWAATSGRFLNLFAPLGIVIAVLFAVLDFISAFVSFGGVAELGSLWLQTMIGIGILTRLHIGFFGSDPSEAAMAANSKETV